MYVIGVTKSVIGLLSPGSDESLFVLRCPPPVGAKGCVRGLFGVTESVLGVLSHGAAESLFVLRWVLRWCQRLRAWFVRCHRLCSWFVKSWRCREFARTSLGPPLVPKAAVVVCSVSPIMFLVC